MYNCLLSVELNGNVSYQHQFLPCTRHNWKSGETGLLVIITDAPDCSLICCTFRPLRPISRPHKSVGKLNSTVTRLAATSELEEAMFVALSSMCSEPLEICTPIQSCSLSSSWNSWKQWSVCLLPLHSWTLHSVCMLSLGDWDSFSLSSFSKCYNKEKA